MALPLRLDSRYDDGPARRVPLKMRVTAAQRAEIKHLAAYEGVSVGVMLDRYVLALHGQSHVYDDLCADAEAGA